MDLPPTYESAHYADVNLEKQFIVLAERHEIGSFFVQKLRQLSGFQIVLILDDSGSMNSAIKDKSTANQTVTRWMELKEAVNIIVDIGAVFDTDGLDLYFLNRGLKKNITNAIQVAEHFHQSPTGFTPISRVLRQVLHDNINVVKERKLLIFIITDGQPTNDKGDVDLQTLEKILLYERQPLNQIFVTTVICTDEESTVNYLNQWDSKIPNFDVVDDYDTEKTQIQQIQGPNFMFTKGDYIVKMLLGSVDPSLGDLDEIKQNSNQSCCTIL